MVNSNDLRVNTHIRFHSEDEKICQLLSDTQIDGSASSTASSSSSDSDTLNSPSTPTMTPMGDEEGKIYIRHMKLLSSTDGQRELGDAITTPIFTMPVLEHVKKSLVDGSDVAFAQYGLLAGIVDGLTKITDLDALDLKKELDSRIFLNITSPSSIFICGSQGSGKSHTLSCMLENALSTCDANVLSNPLTGLVFHYDTFISDHGGSPCEAAFLSSNDGIKVRVLCAPTNLATIKAAYSQFENVEIEPLKINQSDLNTKRMMDLMAVAQNDGHVPLYINTIYRILREMRMNQQASGQSFKYLDFKELVKAAKLSPDQNRPLQQRLDTLESFMPNGQTASGQPAGQNLSFGNDWTPKAGTLTIVDLSCPCVTPESACALFNICLTIFLEQATNLGRIVALDEAHKYMNASAEASVLTQTLLSTVRLQRHLGARIIISTQEPTISPALLDLSSVTIVHRFTSPEWLKTLQGHLAGASSKLLKSKEDEEDDEKETSSVAEKVFKEVVKLKVGEALLFSPSAVIGIESVGKEGDKLKRLGTGFVKIRVRSRLTTDGGKSVLAT